MTASIELDRFYFIKNDSVTFGSYTYDEPRNDQNERLITFGEVPVIVYSETAGDLARITGEQTPEETS